MSFSDARARRRSPDWTEQTRLVGVVLYALAGLIAVGALTVFRAVEHRHGTALPLLLGLAAVVHTAAHAGSVLRRGGPPAWSTWPAVAWGALLAAIG